MREGTSGRTGGARAPWAGTASRGVLAGLIAFIAAAIAAPESFAQG